MNRSAKLVLLGVAAVEVILMAIAFFKH